MKQSFSESEFFMVLLHMVPPREQCVPFPKGPEYCSLTGGSDDKESVCNAGDLGSIHGSGKSPGEGNGRPLHYYWLGNPKAIGAWWATFHKIVKSMTSEEVTEII